MSNQDALILLVEGRSAGASSMSAAIRKSGFGLAVVATGAEAIRYAEEVTEPDLVVYDATTMRSSGARTCRRLRKLLGETPIIHCRAADEMEDQSAEADVYLSHPFTPRKLLNRMKQLLPAARQKEEMVRHGNICYYRTRRTVEVNGKGERRLTPKLSQLLEEFLRFPNQLVSRLQLMRNVWNTEYLGDTRTLDVHMRWLREYIETNPAQPEVLQTVRGKGYIFSFGPK